MIVLSLVLSSSSLLSSSFFYHLPFFLWLVVTFGFVHIVFMKVPRSMTTGEHLPLQHKLNYF